MRVLFLTLTVCLLVLVASSTPIDPHRRLINRPSQETIMREKREPQGVKGGKVHRTPGVKGHSPTTPSTQLRKGEYVCNGRVCKLVPGEIPKGCNGVCQYPV